MQSLKEFLRKDTSDWGTSYSEVMARDDAWANFAERCSCADRLVVVEKDANVDEYFEYRERSYRREELLCLDPEKGNKYAVVLHKHHYWAKEYIEYRRIWDKQRRPVRRTCRRIPAIRLGGPAVENGCQLHAFAAITEAPMEVVEGLFREEGWTPKDPGNIESAGADGDSRWAKLLALYNLELVLVKDYGWDDKKITVKTFCKSHGKGVYLLKVKEHVCVVKDGTLFDTNNSSYKRVKGIYKVEWQSGRLRRS